MVHTEVAAHVCGAEDFDGEVLVDFADDFNGVSDCEVGVLWVERGELLVVYQFWILFRSKKRGG